MEVLIPDPELCKRVIQPLFSGGALVGQDSVFSEMPLAMVNAALTGKLDHYMEKQAAADDPTNVDRRNGRFHKTLRSTVGPLAIATPRGRLGLYEPMLIKKR